MSTEIAKKDGGEIVVGNLTRNQVGLIKRTIAKGFTDDELQLFLFQAERKGLDPLSREIYGFKGGDGRISIVTGIDGFRARADATGRYMPGREPDFEVDDDGKLVKATAYVQRWDAKTGAWIEIAASAWYDEQQRNTPVWNKMPRVMLAKCAEAIAFRRAFPADFGGMYTPDELPANTAPRYVEAEIVTPAVAHQSPAPVPMVDPLANLLAQPTPEQVNDELARPPSRPAPPPAEPVKGRTRSTKCKRCGELFGPGIIKKGLCADCRDPAKFEEPDPAPEISPGPPAPDPAPGPQLTPYQRIAAAYKEAIQVRGVPAATVSEAMAKAWPDYLARKPPDWTPADADNAEAIIGGLTP
jgi:phage recombination protein Bet